MHNQVLSSTQGALNRSPTGHWDQRSLQESDKNGK